MTTLASGGPISGAVMEERRPSIAVVDDDSGFAGYLRTFLALRGYEARSYTRGDEIVAAIRQGEPPDIVLLDVAMPGMDGIQTLKALKSARPELQVIMLSGREQANIIVEAVRLGAADYVVKPDDPEGLGEIALDAAIKQAIERNRLLHELSDLRRQLSDDQNNAFLAWSDSPAMRQVAMIIEQVADSDVTVLIRGESGVGKELVARGIHQRSTRRNKPFVKVNCAALPAELLESELFGHEKGAFTGAATARIGKFEQANLGTILLDEIGEMKPPLQAKLLHVLQDGEFTKLGSNKRITIDVRVVAATNRDLEQMMLRGEFREDLYYRLKVIEASVPALRERRDEIPQLTDFFIAKYSQRYNRPVRMLSNELRQMFQSYDWPGNVRELENMIKRFVILQDENLVMRELAKPRTIAANPAGVTTPPSGALPREYMSSPPPPAPPVAAAPPVAQPAAPSAAVPAAPTDDDDTEDLDEPAPAPTSSPDGRRLADVAREASLAAERVAIADTLRQVHWNRRKAAQILGVSYKTLLNKIKETGIERP
ncbi:MAG TPA: sigma-54 dependent transcriptional regulator [Vicinamibacterales bacterium]|jgi:two-component system response regulator AtoC|nr:sigma-54 dependent transcriptional regulator [Vicinamibacterales bacterium]